MADAAPATPEQTPPPSYRDTVLDDEPSAYWTLDETGPNVVDIAGDEIPATYGTTAVPGGPPALADEEGASVSAARGQTTVTASADPVGAGTATVEFWHKSSGNLGEGEIPQTGWLARWGGRGVFNAMGGFVGITDGTTTKTFFAAAWLDTPGWQHWVVIQDPSQGPVLFVNGQRLATWVYPATAPAVPPGHPAFEMSNGGGLDELAVYSRRVTEAEIRAHWERGLGLEDDACPARPDEPTGYLAAVLDDDPTAAYDFEDYPDSGVGRLTPLDVSGHCRHGSVLGMVSPVTSGIYGGGDGIGGDGPEVDHGAFGFLLLDRESFAAERTFEFWARSNVVALDGDTVAEVSNRVWLSGEDGDVDEGLMDGSWHHYALVTTEDELRMYVDGVVESTADPESSNFATEATSLYFNPIVGGIDGVATYDSALTPERVGAHWRAGLEQQPPACAPKATSMYAKVLEPDQPAAHLSLDDRTTEGGLPVFASDGSGSCARARYGANAAPSTAEVTVSGPTGSVEVEGEGDHAAASLRIPGGMRSADWWMRTESDTPGFLARFGSRSLWWTGSALALVDGGTVPEPWQLGTSWELGDVDLADGEWHHVALLTKTQQSIRVLIDGEVVVDYQDPGWWADPFATLTIGGVPGTYDEIAGYKTTLADPRVQAHAEGARSFRTVTTLTADPNRWVAGLDITLHAEVEAPEASAVPGGQIRFYDGSTILGTADIVDGAADFTLESVTAGKHRVRASYLPAAGFAASSSQVLVRSGLVQGELTLAVDPDAVLVGEELEFTASLGPVDQESAPASGVISFAIDGGAALDVDLGDDAVAKLVRALPVGEHEVVATYAGDAEHPAGTDSVAVTVSPLGAGLQYFYPFTWDFPGSTRQVSGRAVDDASKGLEGFDAELWLDGEVVDTGTTDNYGSWILTIPSVEIGAHDLAIVITDPEGVYEEIRYDGTYHGVVKPEVAFDLPTGPVTGAPNPLPFTVTASNGAIMDNLAIAVYAGNQTVGWARVENGGGTIDLQSLPDAENDLSFDVWMGYGGDDCYYDPYRGTACDGVGPVNGEVGTILQEAAPSELHVTHEQTEDGTRLLVQVRAEEAGRGPVNRGDLEIEIDGETTVYTLQNQGSNIRTAVLPAGEHDIEVRYLGTAAWEPSTVTLDDERIKARPTLDITATPTPILVGEPVTLSFDLTSDGGGDYGGTLNFWESEGDADFVAEASPWGIPVPADGHVEVTGAFRTSGSMRFVAYTSGDDGHYGTSTAATFEVTGTGTETTLTLDPAAVNRGEHVAAQVEVASIDASSGQGGPVGTVSIRDQWNSTLAYGEVQPGATDGTSRVQLTVPTGSLGLGTRTLTAVFSGRNGYGPSSDAADLQLVRSQSRTDFTFDPGRVVPVGETVSIDAVATSLWGDSSGSASSPALTMELDGEPFGSADGDTGATGSFVVTAGVHEVKATFAGTSTLLPSERIAQVVGVPDYEVDLTVPPTSKRYSSFDATVTATAGSDPLDTTAMVYLFEGDTMVAWRWVSSFPATLGVSGLERGDHELRAVVCPILPSQGWITRGECEIDPVESAVEDHTVTKATASVVYWSPVDSAIRAMEPFTLDAYLVVDGGNGISEGTATFTVDGVELDPVPVQSARARLSHPGLAGGTHDIEVHYSGTDDIAPFDVSRQVSFERLQVSLQASAPSPVLSGRPLDVAVAATLSPSGRPPLDGPITVTTASHPYAVLGTGEMANGTASVDVGTLAVGTHSLRVVYAGDAGHEPATTSLSVTVRKATSETTLRIDPDQPEPGDALELIAKVAVEPGSTWDPEGFVHFFDDDGSESGEPIAIVSVDPDTGEATFSIAGVEAGSHVFRAVYAGTGRITGSPAAAVERSVLAAPEVSVTTSGPSVVGEEITVDVEVASDVTADPTGEVVLTVDGSPVDTLDLEDGAASTKVRIHEPGDHEVVAHYEGDSRHWPAEGETTQTVGKADTTLKLTVPERAARGDAVPVTVKATVDQPGSGIPSGTVRIDVDGQDSGVEITLDGTGSGTAQLESLPEGHRTISVSYDGDARMRSADAQGQVTVRPATGLQLRSSTSRATVGTTVTLTATVSERETGEPATGQVSFRIDGVHMRTVDLEDGTAELDVPRLEVGTHAIGAVLVVSDEYHSSQDEVQVVIDKAPVSVTATLGSSTVPLGGAVTVTARVTHDAGGLAPTGHVQFSVDGQSKGSSVLRADGTAPFTITGLTLGNHQVVATYLGDASFLTKASSAAPVTIAKAATTAVISTSANPAVVGGTLRVSVRVTSSPASAGTPTGEVSLFDGDDELHEPVELVNGIATFDLEDLPVGVYALRARYLESTSFNASSWATYQQVVGRPVSVDLEVQPGQSPYTYGDQVTYDVTVASLDGGAVPTGKVELRLGDARIGNVIDLVGGTATFQRPLTSAGSLPLYARYLGDATYGRTDGDELDLTVAKRATTTNLVIRATSGAGRTMDANVTVTSGGPSVSGPVQIVDASDHVVGSGWVGGGSVRIGVSGLARGAHDLRAVFPATDNFVGSQSSAKHHTVGDPVVASGKVLNVTAQPNGDYRVTETPGAGGTVVTFNGAASSGPGAVFHTWRFPSGARAGAGETVLTGDQVQFPFARPGVYRVVLTVGDDPTDPDQLDTTAIRVVVTPNEAALAKAGDDRIVAEDAVVWFDATASRPSIGSDIQWEFPGNQFSNDPHATFIFDTPGEYTVRLRVTANGTTSTDDVNVKVLKTVVDDGLHVTVRNHRGQLVQGAEVVVVDAVNRHTATTNSQGKARIRGLANAKYTVYAIAPGYKPAMALATVDGSVGEVGVGVDPQIGILGVGTVEMSLEPGTPVGDAVIEANPVDPSRYDELGIANSEGNTVVTEYVINLDFDKEVTGPEGEGRQSTFYVDSWGNCAAGCDVPRTKGEEVEVVKQEPGTPGLFKVITFPAASSYLKQFFEVKLTVINLTEGAHSFVGGSATLNLPAGLSLADLTTQAQAYSVEMPDIPTGSSRTATWIIRGDSAGSYNVSADYAAVLSPFSVPVNLSAATTTPITVVDAGPLQMTVTTDDKAFIEQKNHLLTDKDSPSVQKISSSELRYAPYEIRKINLTNPSSVPMYNVNLYTSDWGAGFAGDPLGQTQFTVPVIGPGQTASVGPITFAPLVEPADLPEEEEDPEAPVEYDVWKDRSRDLVPDESSIQINGDDKGASGINAVGTAERGLDMAFLKDADIGEWRLRWDGSGAAEYDILQAAGPGAPFNVVRTVHGTTATIKAPEGQGGLRSVFTVISKGSDGSRRMAHKTIVGYSASISPVQITGVEWICSGIGAQVEFDWVPTDDPITSANIVHFDVDPDSPEAAEKIAEIAEVLLAPDPFKTGKIDIKGVEGASANFPISANADGHAGILASQIWSGDPPDRALLAVRIKTASGQMSLPVVVGATNDCGDGGEELTQEDSLGALCEVFTGGLATTNEANPTSDCPSDPVNLASGNLVSRKTDASLPGPGEAFEFERVYNSLDTTVGAMGPGWSHRYEASIVTGSNNTVVFRGASGSQVRYKLQADGTYKALTASSMTLHKTLANPLDPNSAFEWDAQTLGGRRWHFDAIGRLQYVHDRNGEGPSMGYTGTKLTSITTNGWTVTLGYSGALLNLLTLPDGRTVQFTYSGGRMVNSRDLNGNYTYYTYDGRGRLNREKNHLQQVEVFTEYEDKDKGRVIRQTDAAGGLTTFGWAPTASGGRATMTDPRGNAWTQDYVRGRLVKRTNPLGQSTRTQYDTKNRVSAVIDARGNAVKSFYDSKGRLSRRTNPIPGAHDEEWTYNGDNQLATYTDVSGRLTRYGYDSLGRITNIIGPGAQRTVTRFNSRGLPDWVCQGANCRDDIQDVDGDRAFKYEYDLHGRPTLITTPAGRITRMDYPDLKTVDTYAPKANGTLDATYRTRVLYDNIGRPRNVTRPNGQWVSTSYDYRGRVLVRSDANGYKVENTYYPTGDLQKVLENGRAAGTTYERDANGNVTAEVSPLGRRTTFRYDAANRLIGKTEPLGNVGSGSSGWDWTYAYDAAGNLRVVTRPDGYRTTTEYDTGNRPISMTDSLGRTTSSTWYPDGSRKTAKDADGRTQSWYLDGAGRLDHEVDPLGNTTEYLYNARSNVSQVTTVDGTTKYSYDPDGLLTEVISPRGVATSTPNDFRTVIGRDPNGNVEFVDDPAGGRTEYGYDASGRPTSVKDPRGFITTTTYDKQDRPVLVTQPRASAGESPSTIFYTYPDGGLSTKVAKSVGGFELEKRDLDGLVTQVETDTTLTTYTRDANGRPLTATNLAANGPATTTFAYSRTGSGAGMRDLTVVRDPLGRESRTTTDALGLTRSQRNPAGGLTEYTYTPGGRLTSVTGAESASPVDSPSTPGARPVQRYAYAKVAVDGGYGERITRTDALGNNWVTTNDAAGRTVSSKTPEGRTTSREYDEVGNLVKETAPGNLVTTYKWGALDELLETDGPGTAPVTYTYNAAKQMTSVTASNGGTTTFERDARGNMTKRTGPDGTFELFNYDAADRLNQYTGQAGNREWYGYDAKNRYYLKQTQIEDIQLYFDAASNVTSKQGRKLSGPTLTQSYTYDQTNQIVTATGQTGTTTYERNDAGQISKVTSPDGIELGYTWAPDGSRESFSMPDVTQRTSYRADGAESEVRFDLPEGSSSTRTYTYDRDGLMLAEKIEGWTYRSYERDPATGQPTRYQQDLGNDHRWTEDLTWSDGRLASRSVDEGDDTEYDIDYEYDQAGQLTSEVTTGDVDLEREYGYTSYGALDWSKTDGELTDFSYNAARRLTSAVSPGKTRTFTYDHVGRRLTDKVTGGPQKTFTYDPLGRQATSTLAQTGHPTASQSLEYDGEGNLSRVTGTDGQPGSTPASFDFTWDSLRAVPEVAVSRGENQTTLLGYAGGRRIGMVNVFTGSGGDPEVSAAGFAYDALDNPVGTMSDDGTGRDGIVQDSFGPYGEGVKDQPIGFGYGGELTLLDGLVHLRARNYDPSTASFTSRDPLPGVVGTTTLTNPFAYANNDPLNQDDPLGLRGECKGEWYQTFSCNAFNALKDLPGAGIIRAIFDEDYRELIREKGAFDAWTGMVLGDSLDDMVRNPSKIIPNMINGLKAFGNSIGECMMNGGGACGDALFGVVMIVMPGPKLALGGKLGSTLNKLGDLPVVRHLDNLRNRLDGLSTRLDNLQNAATSRLDNLAGNLSSRLDNVKGRLDDIKSRMGVDHAVQKLKSERGAIGSGPTRKSDNALTHQPKVSGETYFRTMSKAHAEELAATGRISPTKETFISPSQAYSAKYDGVLVEITVESGTTKRLEGIGVRDQSRLVRERYPDMPMVQKGWAESSALFKGEGGVLNIGLGTGDALKMFNDSIIGHRVIRP